MIWLLFYLKIHLIGLNNDGEVTCTEVCVRNSVTITFQLDSFNKPHQLEIPQGKRVKKKKTTKRWKSNSTIANAAGAK